MLELEVEIMIICLRTKPDLFYYNLGLLGLELLLLLFLLIKELAVIDDFTNRRICSWGDLYQVELKFFGDPQGFLQGNDARILYVLPNNTNNAGPYFLIDPEFFAEFVPFTGRYP
jgi:hypothetical protein